MGADMRLSVCVHSSSVPIPSSNRDTMHRQASRSTLRSAHSRMVYGKRLEPSFQSSIQFENKLIAIIERIEKLVEAIESIAAAETVSWRNPIYRVADHLQIALWSMSL
jgi:hypothetical protein